MPASPRAAVLLVALASSHVSAAEPAVERRQDCGRGGVTRVVELRETPGDGLPCQVVYAKPDEDGSERVLWFARIDRAFCTARFESLVAKLESKFGWACEIAEQEPVARAPEGADDAGPGARALPETVLDEDVDAAGMPAPVESAAPGTVPEPNPGEDPDALARAIPDSRADVGSETDTREPLNASGDEAGVEAEPAIGAAVAAAALPGGATDDASAPIDRLLALVPPGDYAPAPMPSDDRAEDGRVALVCPPGGTISWKVDDPERPVLALGETIRLGVRLPPDATFDEASSLGIVSSVGEGVTREAEALVPAPARPSAESGAAFDLRVAPRGPGSGALSTSVCRYVLAD